MDENRYIRIAVEPMDALPDVLTKVRTHGGRPVFLSIPPASPLFLTASEFRALRETVRASNTNLVVVSEDRQRQDFARLFNLIPAADEAEAIAWIDGQSAQKPSSSQAIDPALGPPRSGNGSGWAPRTEVIRPNEASGSVPQSPEPEPAAEPAATTTALVPVADTVPMPEPADQRKRRRWPWLLALLFVLVLVTGAAAGLPQATVTLTRQRTPISTEVPIIVTESGGEAAPDGAIAIDGQRQSANVSVSVTLPATGQLFVPDLPASGGLSFANTGTSPVTLPAGTEIISDGGIVFTLDAEVTVPAATGGVSGNADGTVTAAEGGSAGNLTQGALSGRHESGVFFNNRNGALTGGTDRETTVVSEDDMATAVDALNEQIAPALGEVLSDSAGSTIVVLPTSATHAELTPESDIAVGAEATEFTVTASTYATGLTFSLESAREAILNAAMASVTVPEGQAIDLTDAEITFGPAADASTNDAIATVLIWQVADLNDEAVEALPDDLARGTVDEAIAAASAIEGVESVTIEIKPDWLPSAITDRMPLVPQRIEIRES